MRIVSFRHEERTGVGVVRGDVVVPYRGVAAIDADHGEGELLSAGLDESAALPVAQLHLLPASPNPRRVLCVGLNFHSHIEETGRELPAYPVLFPKFASSLIGANDPILLPPEVSQLDYEGELAVVIGRRGRRIPESEAARYILGYSVANDVTMRDFQYLTHQWLQGKAWDRSTPLGPWIVTPDEVNIERAGIRTWVNDQLVQDSDLSQLIFSIPHLIAVISEFTELEPGDIILTGTPGGVGYRRDPQLFLNDSDRVSVEVEGVGRLDSVVRKEVL